MTAITQKMTPRITAGQIRWGRLVTLTSSAERETDPEDGAHDAAIDGERSQAVRLEEAEQELHRKICGDGCAERADQRLAADVIALRAEQVGELEDAGGADDRRGEQEGEARGLLVGKPGEQAAAHAGAG